MHEGVQVAELRSGHGRRCHVITEVKSLGLPVLWNQNLSTYQTKAISLVQKDKRMQGDI